MGFVGIETHMNKIANKKWMFKVFMWAKGKYVNNFNAENTKNW